MNRLRALWRNSIAFPVTDGDRVHQEYLTRLILVMMSIALCVFTIPIVVGWVAGVFEAVDVIIMLMLDMPVFAGLWLTHRGRWQWGRQAPPLMFFLLASYITSQVGLLTTALLFYVIAVMLTAMLQGVEAQWGMLLLSIATYLVVGWIHGDRTLDILLPVTITVSGSLIGISLLQWLSTSLFRQSLVQARAYAEELKESEERFRALVQNSSDIIVLLETDRTVRYISPSVEHILGYGADYFEGQNLFDQIHPEDVPATRSVLNQAAQQPGVPVTHEFRLQHSNDSWIDIETVTNNLTDKPGVAGVVVNARDITARKQAEKSLKERTRALQALHKVTLDISAELERAGLLQRMVKRAMDLLGADRGVVLFLYESDENGGVLRATEACGLGVSYMGASIRPGEGITGQVFQNGKPLTVTDYGDWEGRTSLYTNTDVDIPKAMLAVPLLWREDTCGVLTLSADARHRTFGPDDIWLAEMFAAQAVVAIESARLHERVRQHASMLEEEVARQTAEVRRQHEQMRAILQNVGDAIALIDPQGVITYINPAFTALLQYESDEIIGNILPGMLENPHLLATAKQVMHTLLNQETWRSELTLPRKDATTCETDITVVPVLSYGDEIEGFVVSIRDIGRFKQLDRMKTRFMQTVSHELKNPLSSIRIYTQLLRSSKAEDGEQRQRYLDKLEGETTRLLNTTLKVLDATRFADTEAIGTWKTVSISAILEDATVRFKYIASAARVTLTVAPAATLPRIQGDPTWLTRALQELVENAVKFTKKNGAINISAHVIEEKKPSRIAIHVHNSGDNIQAEHLSQILDAFERGAIGDSGHIPGIGLGLTIVQLILRPHGGELTVESDPKGTTFTMMLPIAR